MSELGLIHHRVEVEVEYFLALVAMPLPQLGDFPQDKVEACRDIHRNFNEADAQWVKDKERITNHDVKAVEYFVKEAMERLGVGAWKEFVHFGLTSQDVNNTAIPLSLKRATEQAVLPLLDTLTADLQRWRQRGKRSPCWRALTDSRLRRLRWGKKSKCLWIAFAANGRRWPRPRMRRSLAGQRDNSMRIMWRIPTWIGLHLDANLWRGALV